MYTTDLVCGVPWCLPEAKANTLGKNTASTLGLKEFLPMYFQGIWIHSQKSNAHTKSKYHEQKPAETDSRIRPAKTQTSAHPFLPEAAEIKCNHSLTEQFNLSYPEMPTALSSPFCKKYQQYLSPPWPLFSGRTKLQRDLSKHSRWSLSTADKMGSSLTFYTLLPLMKPDTQMFFSIFLTPTNATPWISKTHIYVKGVIKKYGECSNKKIL